MTAVDNTASNALPSLWSSNFQVVDTQREELLVQNAGMGDLEICRATTWRPTIRMIATVALRASESQVLRDRDVGSLESQGQDMEGSCVMCLDIIPMLADSLTCCTYPRPIPRILLTATRPSQPGTSSAPKELGLILKLESVSVFPAASGWRSVGSSSVPERLSSLAGLSFLRSVRLAEKEFHRILSIYYYFRRQADCSSHHSRFSFLRILIAYARWMGPGHRALFFFLFLKIDRNIV